MTKKVVGKKQENKGMSNISYTLYDNCNICPLRVYVNLICDDNLQSLIIEGKAPEDILKATKSKLIIEFAELSGNVQMLSLNNTLKKIFLYRNNLLILQMCGSLITSGDTDTPKEYLKQFGLSFDSEERVIKRIEAKMKEIIVRLNKELAKYNDESSNENQTPTSQIYNDQLAYLSSHFKFNIDMNITLAQYASYLKLYNQASKINHGKLK